MRKSLLALLAAGLAFGPGSPAWASTATLTGSVLEIQLAPNAFPTASFGQSPTSIPIFVSSGAGSFVEPASIFTGTAVFPTTLFTGISLISSLTISVANGTKIISAGGGPGGGFGGTGPLFGNARIGVLGGLINLTIPLSVVGGLPPGTVMAGAASLLITVTGTGWTTGPAVVTGITTTTTPNGQVVNTVALSGSDGRTPTNHAGPLTLVSGARVKTNAAGNLPLFAVQRLNFLPEPGAFLLLGAGAAVLFALGRRGR